MLYLEFVLVSIAISVPISGVLIAALAIGTSRPTALARSPWTGERAWRRREVVSAAVVLTAGALALCLYALPLVYVKYALPAKIAANGIMLAWMIGNGLALAAAAAIGLGHADLGATAMSRAILACVGLLAANFLCGLAAIAMYMFIP